MSVVSGLKTHVGAEQTHAHETEARMSCNTFTALKFSLSFPTKREKLDLLLLPEFFLCWVVSDEKERKGARSNVEGGRVSQKRETPQPTVTRRRQFSE